MRTSPTRAHRLPDAHDALAVGVGEGAKERRADRREDGGVRADPGGESGHGDQGEAAGLCQGAECIVESENAICLPLCHARATHNALKTAGVLPSGAPFPGSDTYYNR